MRPVVVGVDGSKQSARALAWALPYAAVKGTTVLAIMTVPSGDDPEQTRAAIQAAEVELAGMVERAVNAVEPAPPVSSEVVEGDPAVSLVNASRDAELIVLGSHGQSKIMNPVLGSVSLACIRMGSCPVLVIPPGPPEPPSTEGALETT